jgi:putative hydrolase of the HAD superfamily
MAERHILAVCFDFGDTLVDEASEVKDDTLTTLQAQLIPGAAELLQELKRRGYRLALVADGRPGTYFNVLGHYGLDKLFDAWSISEDLGVLKPDRRMFIHALERLGIGPEQYGRTLMVGNRLERDVRGANGLGMISVWMDWSPRYAKLGADPTEQPRFRVREPLEVLNVIDELERLAGSGQRSDRGDPASRH